jgi:hypothetical protein
MKNSKTIFIILILFSIIKVNAQDKKTIQVEKGQLSFANLVQLLKTNGIDAHFKDSLLLQNSFFPVDTTALSIEELSSIIRNKSEFLGIYIKPASMYFVKKSAINEHIGIKSNPLHISEHKVMQGSRSKMEERYLEGKKNVQQKTFVIGKKTQKQEDVARVQGSIVNIENGEEIIGATVYVKSMKSGTVTDVLGNFVLNLPVGEYNVELRNVGMKSMNCHFIVNGSGTVSIQMEKAMQSLAEVTVDANKLYNIRGATIGLDKVSMKSVQEMPTFMGERDIIRVSQMLPGIVNVSEGSGGINVRGGNADQNLFLLNDIVIYNTNHAFGFFSAVNPTNVKGFSIYKGYIPIDYSGRLSSVFKIDTRRGNKKKLYAQGSFSPIASSVNIEGPIIKDKLSFVFSGRLAYPNWILDMLHDETVKNSNLGFNDFTGSLDYRITKNTRVNLFAYQSTDKFDFFQTSLSEYVNTIGGVKVFHRFNENLSANLNASQTQYKFLTVDKHNLSEAYEQNFALKQKDLNFRMQWTLGDSFIVYGGAKVKDYFINRGTIKAWGEESKMAPIPLGREHAMSSSLYSKIKYKPTSFLELELGANFTNLTIFGVEDMLLYESEAPRNPNHIKDTLLASQNNILKNYSYPEIRFSAAFELSANDKLKFAYNRMVQDMFLLSNSYAISPTDQWKLADYHIEPSTSDQLSVAYYRFLPSLGSSFSVESYIKDSKNVPDFIDGADFIHEPNVEQFIIQGKQKAYGIECMLNKEDGKLNGWVSYCYSRSFMHFNGEQEWQKINNGKIYPSNFDKPHVVNLAINYRVTKRIAFSSSMSYSTGRPITLPTDVYYLNRLPLIEYSDRNEHRIKDYFRADASVTIDGSLKKKKFLHSTWTLSVFNLTGRNNPFSIYFNSENNNIVGYQYSVIGSPIFTIALNLKLGNYANE